MALGTVAHGRQGTLSMLLLLRGPMLLLLRGPMLLLVTHARTHARIWKRVAPVVVRSSRLPAKVILISHGSLTT